MKDIMNYSSLSDVVEYINWTGNDTLITNQSVYYNSIPYLITTQTICVIGTVLNTLVIIVIVYGSLMRTSVFMILLLVLAIFDNLTLCLVVLIQVKVYSYIPLSSSIWVCRIVRFSLDIATNISSWIIVLISAERTIAVFWPLKAHIYCTKRKSILTILMVIIIMCVVAIPRLFSCSIIIINGMNTCHSVGSGSPFATVHSIFNGFIYCIIPFFIISTLNILTLRNIQSKRKFRIKHQTSQKGKSASLNHSLTVTMYAVCIVFGVTTLPGRVASTILTISKLLGTNLITRHSMVWIITHMPDLVNHSINFLLYCLTGSVFRQALVRLLQSFKPRKMSRNIQEPCPTIEGQVL